MIRKDCPRNNGDSLFYLALEIIKNRIAVNLE